MRILASLVVPALALALAPTLAGAQTEPRPDVPDAIRAHANEQVVLRLHASGLQIYNCRSDADGKFGWILKAPDAELTDRDGKIIGHHSAGPTWKLNDGSEVKGKASGHVDSTGLRLYSMAVSGCGE